MPSSSAKQDDISTRLASKARDSNHDPSTDLGDISDDELLEELEREDDFDMSSFRERRLEELRRELEKSKALKESDHGRYTELKHEKDVINETAKEKLCVIHFSHRDFRRCRIMDKHMETLASRYFRTRFIKVDVANVPFLVEKLKVQVLPCLVCFVDGVTKDRLIGFEELGNNDNFSTASLEIRLKQSGAIVDDTTSYSSQASSFRRPGLGAADEDDLDIDD